MSRHSNAVRLLAGAALVAVAACSDSTSPPSKEPVPVLQAAQSPDLAALARAVPGFGGLFLDHGVPIVYLTDASQRGKVERALGAFATHIFEPSCPPPAHASPSFSSRS